VLFAAACLFAGTLAGPASASAADPIVGTWVLPAHPATTVDVSQVADMKFDGILHGAQACAPQAEGTVVWEITGGPGSYTGTYNWRHVSDCSISPDPTATFTVTGDTLEACTTAPGQSTRVCTKYARKVDETAACDEAGAALDRAKKRLTKAKTSLRRARRGGDDLKITRAKKKVKKAKQRVAGAKERRRQACAS
jgi:hypothetical protein